MGQTFEYLKMALQNIRANKGRSLLTMLGIIIGISSVIRIMSVGAGFKNEMNNGNIEEFDGISLVEWTKDDKIKSLKEFGCNLNNYNPYEHSDQPEFREERASWF